MAPLPVCAKSAIELEEKRIELLKENTWKNLVHVSGTTMNPRSIAVIEMAAAPPKRCGINDESMRLLTGAQLTKDVLEYILYRWDYCNLLWSY